MMKESHYRHLIAMAALSFLAMHILMYAMVNTIADVYMNVNQVYMAGLMTAPMLVIELLVMRGMYHNRKLNALIIGAGVIGGVVLFVLIRQQTAVGDEQFCVEQRACLAALCAVREVENRNHKPPDVTSACGFRFSASHNAG
jgi:peptidoglycan/LPS O-acetylase OafA/YrhL